MAETWKSSQEQGAMGASTGAGYGTGPVLPGQGPEASGQKSRHPVARLVAFGVLVAVLLWFAFANLQGVPIHFWVVTRTAPLIVVVAISGVLGAVVTATWSRVRRRRAKRAQ